MPWQDLNRESLHLKSLGSYHWIGRATMLTRYDATGVTGQTIWSKGCSGKIVDCFLRIFILLPSIPRQHWDDIGRTDNGQPVGVTVHSYCFEWKLLSSPPPMKARNGCSRGLGHIFLQKHPVCCDVMDWVQRCPRIQKLPERKMFHICCLMERSLCGFDPGETATMASQEDSALDRPFDRSIFPRQMVFNRRRLSFSLTSHRMNLMCG